MLQNIILYTTSSAAQVWAALLVFVVLAWRDAKSAKVDELHRMMSDDTSGWSTVISLVEQTEGAFQAALKNHKVRVADFKRSYGSVDCFGRAVTFVFVEQVIDYLESTQRLNAESVARIKPFVMDAIERLRSLERLSRPPKDSLITGSVAIFVNLAAIASANISERCHEELLVWIVAGILLANFLAGAYIVTRAYAAIRG